MNDRRSNRPDLRHASGPRIHQQSVKHDNSYYNGYNVTPTHSNYLQSIYANAYPAGAIPFSYQHQLAGPLQTADQSLTDPNNMGSISGGSTASSNATLITRRCDNDAKPYELQFDRYGIHCFTPSEQKVASVSSPMSRDTCDHRKSSPATMTPSHSIMKPSTAIVTRSASQGYDSSFDYCDTASHYSDMDMRLLRSGSSLIPIANGLATSTANINNSNGSGNIATKQKRATQQSGELASTVTFLSQAGDKRPHAQNSGSIRRGIELSNLSLCSCNANIVTEMNPDSTKVLYKYGLEGESREHTFTCEQNTQIPLRLGRERNDKVHSSLKENEQNDAFVSSEMDGIPPIPPPPVMKHLGSIRNLRFQQRLGSWFYGNPPNKTQPNTITKNNNSANSITPLSRSDILNTWVGSTLDVGSILDDCANSILKCGSGNGSADSGSVCDAKQYKSVIASTVPSWQIPPDLTEDAILSENAKVKDTAAHHWIRNDISMPSGKRCDIDFMHANGMRVAVPTMSYLKKSNTIGSSKDCAQQLKNLLVQKQQKEQWQHLLLSSHCRCLSKSLSNFGRDYDGTIPHDNQTKRMGQKQLPHHNIFYTNDHNWIKDPVATTTPLPVFITRSYEDLVEAGSVAMNQTILTKSQTHAANAVKHSKNLSSLSLTNSKRINKSLTRLAANASSGLKNELNHYQHNQSQLDCHQLQYQSAGKQQQQHYLHASWTSMMPWKHRQCPSRCSSSSGSNSFRLDAAKHWFAVSSILLIIGAASVGVPLALRVAANAPFEERLQAALQLLDQVPLIDGHNDLPWNIRKFLHNKINDFNFNEDLRNVNPWAKSQWSHTDLQRLKRGRVAAQFWAAYVPCEAQHRDAVQLTLEQIDVINRLTDRYAPQLTMCTSAKDIKNAHQNHQICSLTGVEGGHSIGGSLAVLRALYNIGVRYMTLTSTCHTPWADSSYADAPTFNVKHGGLTIFGKTIIREMNRLGMMVDLSHVSTGTMRDALEISEAPVIFSHSSAYEVCNSSRNVQDDMLQSLAKNGGIVMVNFYSKFLSCSENSTVHDAVLHINHIKHIAGIDHVGLGAGFDGINFTPKGLEDVSSYPILFAELLGVGWSMDDLAKLAGGNFLRVMEKVEKLRDEKRAAGVKPYEDHPNFRTEDPYNCTSS